MSRFDINRFKQPPDEEFLCGICKNVLDDPKESPCRHVFCKVCITRALQLKSKCPICRKSFRERHLKDVLPLVQNLLNKLQLECEHVDNGCESPISLEVYVNHIANCDFMMVSCKNELCDEKFLKRDTAQHVCRYTTFLCDQGCECEVLCSERDTHNCVNTLLRKYKGAKETIEKLTKKVTELETNAVDNNRRDTSTNRDVDLDSLSFGSPANLSDISSIGSSLSYRDYNYSLSPDSPINADLPYLTSSPSMSLSIDNDDEDDDLDRWPFSDRRRNVASTTAPVTNDNAGVRGEEGRELQEIVTPSRDGDAGGSGRGLPSHNSLLDMLLGRGNRDDNVESEVDGGARHGVSGDDSQDIPFSSQEAEGTRDGDQLGGARGEQLSGRKRAGGDGSHQAAKRVRHLDGGEQSTSAAGMETTDDGNEDDNGNNEDAASSATPRRRSARLRNLPAGPINDVDDVQVPVPASALLDLYSNELSSNSDDSWIPSD